MLSSFRLLFYRSLAILRVILYCFLICISWLFLIILLWTICAILVIIIVRLVGWSAILFSLILLRLSTLKVLPGLFFKFLQKGLIDRVEIEALIYFFFDPIIDHVGVIGVLFYCELTFKFCSHKVPPERLKLCLIFLRLALLELLFEYFNLLLREF